MKQGLLRALQELVPYVRNAVVIDPGVGDALLRAEKAIAEASIAGIEDAAPDAWQPIETAPKDGTPVWGFDNGVMAVMAWAEEMRWDDHSTFRPDGWELVTVVWPDESSNANPTHWMPLPEAPR